MDVESGSDNGNEVAEADKPAIGAGHSSRTPQMLKDMRKSKVFGALTKSANFGEASTLAFSSFSPRCCQHSWTACCAVSLLIPARLPSLLGTDVHGVITEDKTVNELHQNAEQFDRKTELSFKYLQVCWWQHLGMSLIGRLTSTQGAVALC